MKYAVRITENLSVEIHVEAQDKESALITAMEEYYTCEVVMERSNLTGVSFDIEGVEE